MRTKALLTVAAALTAGVIGAQAQVYSVNIVGYVNQTLTGGGFTAVANPLDAGDNTLDSLLGDIPTGSQVQLWNGAGFDVYAKTPFGAGWSPADGATVELPPGIGAFVNLAGADMTKTWVGDVLTGDLSNDVPSGFSFKGNQAPVAGNANDLGLSAVLATGDQIQKWNGNGYDVFAKTPFGIGWSPSVPEIAVAEGFFIVNNGDAKSWDQSFNP
jgi:hypothetical protein